MKKALFILSLLGAQAAAAESREYSLQVAATEVSFKGLVPDYMLFQHAGYAGFAAAGGRYGINEFFAFDILYGFTPELFAGHDVHSFAAKIPWFIATLGVSDGITIRPLLGLGVVYSPHHELFLMLPRQYPDSYYVPSAARPILAAGMAVEATKKLMLAVEYVVLDSELAYVRDTGRIDYSQIGSFGLSVGLPVD
jgi:hypothetical protein